MNIVSSYASFWRYKINADKSCIMVFGESPQSRLKNRLSRAWYINNSIIPECDEHHHLGILRSVLPSSIYRTTELCSAGRSSFYALNTVGTRFGCLHPLTSLCLYSSLCLPIMLYGCELWSPTKSELLVLMLAPSLHRESTDSLIIIFLLYNLQSLYTSPFIS